MDAESPSRSSALSRRRRRTVLAVVWALSALYALPFVDRGWIPHDEGTIAQSAERVLTGQLPHRDYDEGYTGGLTYLHAAAFRLFGTRLLALRMVLFVFFLAFVPAVYAIALRLASPWAAGLLTLLAVAWSVPNYFASLPSWYNLFFATFGVLALFRHVETGRRRWLVAAGLCAALSVLCKIVGLYDVAAVLLFLAYREQRLASARAEARSGGSTAFLVAKAVGGAVFLGSVAALVIGRRDPMDLVHFVLPAAAIVGFLIWSEWKEGRGALVQRLRGAWRLVAPFALGLLAPLALFLIAYARAGALPDLVRGVFLQSFRQIGTARTPLPPVGSLLPAGLYALLLAFPEGFRRKAGRTGTIVLALVLGIVLALARSIEVYRIVWGSARSLAVVAVVVGCVRLAWRAGRAGPPDEKRQQVFLLLCVTALLGLVQYPFSAPIYFCYVAPLAALAIAGIVSIETEAPRPLHLCVLVFYLLFGLIWTNRGYVVNLGLFPARYEARARLSMPRAGLRVPESDARDYERLVAAIRETAGAAEIYAGPDCPEVYFLSGHSNPTRYFFDFLGDLYGRPDALLALLSEKRVKAVILNRSPGFSAAPSPELRAALSERFPHAREIGKFTLLWRD